MSLAQLACNGRVIYIHFQFVAYWFDAKNGSKLKKLDHDDICEEEEGSRNVICHDWATH